MKMTLNQTKLVELTMKLDLKAREYKSLCNKLEKIKSENIDENSPMLLEIKESFVKNNEEIVDINKQIKQLEEAEDILYKQKIEKYDINNMFKNRNKNEYVEENSIKEKKAMLEYKNASLFSKIINWIKKIFHKDK